MKFIDWALLALVGAMVVLALSRFFKKGGSCSCGGGCNGACPGCGANCPGRKKVQARKTH